MHLQQDTQLFNRMYYLKEHNSSREKKSFKRIDPETETVTNAQLSY